MEKSKLELGTHVISQGKFKRELVEVSKNGHKRESRTFHQVLKNGKWENLK